VKKKRLKSILYFSGRGLEEGEEGSGRKKGNPGLIFKWGRGRGSTGEGGEKVITGWGGWGGGGGGGSKGGFRGQIQILARKNTRYKGTKL